LSLPREVGKHPEGGEPITANFGRYGPYVAHAGKYASLDSPEEVFTVGLNRAVTLLAEKKARGFQRRGQEPLKDLGADPSGTMVKVMKGRYGPYVSDGSVNATIPRNADPMTVTLEQALALLAERVAKGPSKKFNGKAKKAAQTKPEKKPAPKKTKAPAKKKAAKRKPAAVGE